jgi:serine/threonine protein kinase
MKQVEHTNSEREMLVRVRHPFLVNLWGTFHDVNNLYMVMDFVAGGELFSLLRKSQVGFVVLEWVDDNRTDLSGRTDSVSPTPWPSSTLQK